MVSKAAANNTDLYPATDATSAAPFKKKSVTLRVDGAADKGPSHHEVQFFWTIRHLEKGYYAIDITSRSAGQSYLNRVEFQNSLAHSNLICSYPPLLTGQTWGRQESWTVKSIIPTCDLP